ncbi:hypothetical protein GQ53DRAFT_789600 [Thozetella sp. PMI_491]|nr:hypothetical protein GQ53DRAFT_789600 [Thozetella sp. PMI_491]
MAIWVSAASSPCSELTTTEGGLAFNIISNNPETNGRSLQLRPNQYETEYSFPEGTFHYVGLDDSSPVLLADLESGGLFSEERGEDGVLTDLGPTGYLNVKTIVDTTTQYLFSFANATIYANATDPGWLLRLAGDDGTYVLFHDVEVGLVNGFQLCKADFDLNYGPWWVLQYYTYTSTPVEFPNCEPVGVYTIVATEDQTC